MKVQRRFLRGSAWTRVEATDRERHFTVIDVPRGDTIVMRAVLTQRLLHVEIAALEDPARWTTGWISCDAEDATALQGRWEQVGLEADGIADPPDAEGAPGAITTFAGDRFEVRRPDGVVLLAGAFEIDPTTTPRSITWIDSMGPDRGKRLPAIYELDGDRFVFIAADEGAPRPTRFQTSQGQTMRTFARRRALP